MKRQTKDMFPVIWIAAAMLFIGLVPQLRADAHTEPNESDWVQTNGPYGGEILAIYAAPKGVLFAGTEGRVSSVQRIAVILGHPPILDYTMNRERVLRVFLRWCKREGRFMLGRGVLCTHQRMVAIHGIRFQTSKRMNPSVVLSLLGTVYTLAR